jgi:hypothetical protein
MTDSDISDIFSTPATTPPATREQEVFFDFGEFDFLSVSHFPELPWAQFEESGFPSAMILDSTDDPETTIPYSPFRLELIEVSQNASKWFRRGITAMAKKGNCDANNVGLGDKRYHIV